MVENNSDRAVRFGKKTLKLSLYGSMLGAIIGAFGGCLTTSDEVWDSKGPCTAGIVEYHDSVWSTFSARDTPDNRIKLIEQGYKIANCDRKATANEKSSMENERFFYGALTGGVSGAVLGGIIPFIITSWFFLLLMIEQFMKAVRSSPNNHEIRIKRGK